LRALVDEVAAELPMPAVTAAGYSVAAGRDVRITASGGAVALGVIHGNVALPGQGEIAAGSRIGDSSQPGRTGGGPIPALLSHRRLTAPAAGVLAGASMPLVTVLLLEPSAPSMRSIRCVSDLLCGWAGGSTASGYAASSPRGAWRAGKPSVPRWTHSATGLSRTGAGGLSRRLESQPCWLHSRLILPLTWS